MPLWFILRIEWTSEKTIQSRSGAHKIRRVQSDFSIPLMRESFLFKRQPRGFLTKSSNSDGEGNGTPLQYSCLKNPMDKGAWLAAIHGIAKSHTRLSAFTLTFHFHALKKEIGNPLQYSCLENPRDGGAWWAAVYGVAQSRTRLKWLSSNSERKFGWENYDSVPLYVIK